jgi:hypothetical protein
MSRYSAKSHDEAPSRKSDQAERRTKPADVRCPSPAQLERDYNKGKESPSLGDKTDKAYNQSRDSVDRHGRGYNPETSGWVRGEGPIGGGLYPEFDHSPKRGSERRGGNTRGGRCEASGANLEKSPFSAAHKTYGGDSRTVSNDRPSRADLDNPYRKD